MSARVRNVILDGLLDRIADCRGVDTALCNRHLPHQAHRKL